MSVRSSIRWLWKASSGNRLSILVCTLSGIFHIAASMGFIWSGKILVDIATGVSDADIAVQIAIMVGCMVFQMLLGAAENYLISTTFIKVKNRIREKMFWRIMESQWDGREKFHSGDALNRMQEDARVASDTISTAIPQTMTAGLQFVAAFIMMMILDARLSLVIVIIMPIALIAGKLYVRKTMKLTGDIRSGESRVQEHIQENIRFRVLVKSMEGNADAADSLVRMQGELQDSVLNRTRISIISKILIQIGFGAGYLSVFLWGIFGIKSGTVTYGMMTAFLQLVAQVQRPVLMLGRQLPGIVHSLTSAERLSEIDEMPSEEKGDAIQLEHPAGIRFENVSFAYNGADSCVFRNFCHDFKPGSSTAVTGETGAGKTTLIRMMLSLLHPQEGKVVIYDGKQELAASPMTRCNIVYVPQGNTLMSGTVRDNLLLGNPLATEEQMAEALHSAAADFVMELPEGLDTLCGESGAGFSEGQAQRIAIARGLLRNGSILLLDEPTSSVDKDTEALILQRLAKRFPADGSKGTTLIIVTHRESISEICTDTLHITDNL